MEKLIYLPTWPSRMNLLVAHLDGEERAGVEEAEEEEEVAGAGEGGEDVPPLPQAVALGRGL
jgi:hypothetical protein